MFCWTPTSHRGVERRGPNRKGQGVPCHGGPGRLAQLMKVLRLKAARPEDPSGPLGRAAVEAPRSAGRGPGGRARSQVSYPKRPCSRKEKNFPAPPCGSGSPRITWSKSGMPMISPALASRRVVSRSSGLGWQSPLG